MLNVCKKELVCRFNEPVTDIFGARLDDMGFTGTLFGMLDCGRPLDPSATKKRLAAAETIEHVEECLRFVVGDIWLHFKVDDHLVFTSSTSAPPLYLYKTPDELYFTKVEVLAARLASQDGQPVNPYELYDLLSTVRKILTPYGAIFEGIRKVPCGHTVVVDRKLDITHHTYLLRTATYKRKRSKSYNDFKKLLEATAKLYVESGKNLHLYYSGGLDSLTIMYALEKHSRELDRIITVPDGIYDNKIWRILDASQEKLGLSLNIVHADRYSPNQMSIQDGVCRVSSSNNARWTSFVWYAVMEARNNCGSEGHLFFTGSIFDSMYGIDFTTQGFNDPKSIIGRYFYSRMYQNNLGGPVNRFLRKLWYRRKDTATPAADYLEATIEPAMHAKTSYPVLPNRARYENGHFFGRYRDYKHTAVFSSIISDQEELSKLSGPELNRRVRVLKHFQSALLHQRNQFHRDYCIDHHTVHMASEGPIVDFFLDFQLAWPDIIRGKRFMHKYIKECSGVSHSIHFRKGPIGILLAGAKRVLGKRRTRKKIFGASKPDDRMVSRTVGNRSERDRFMFSSAFREAFFRVVDLKCPRVLSYIKDPFIARFVREYYSDAEKGLLSVDDTQDIYNLELFLQSVEEPPEEA